MLAACEARQTVVSPMTPWRLCVNGCIRSALKTNNMKHWPPNHKILASNDAFTDMIGRRVANAFRFRRTQHLIRLTMRIYAHQMVQHWDDDKPVATGWSGHPLGVMRRAPINSLDNHNKAYASNRQPRQVTETRSTVDDLFAGSFVQLPNHTQPTSCWPKTYQIY